MVVMHEIDVCQALFRGMLFAYNEIIQKRKRGMAK